MVAPGARGGGPGAAGAARGVSARCWCCATTTVRREAEIAETLGIAGRARSRPTPPAACTRSPSSWRDRHEHRRARASGAPVEPACTRRRRPVDVDVPSSLPARVAAAGPGGTPARLDRVVVTTSSRPVGTASENADRTPGAFAVARRPDAGRLVGGPKSTRLLRVTTGPSGTPTRRTVGAAGNRGEDPQRGFAGRSQRFGDRARSPSGTTTARTRRVTVTERGDRAHASAEEHAWHRPAHCRSRSRTAVTGLRPAGRPARGPVRAERCATSGSSSGLTGPASSRLCGHVAAPYSGQMRPDGPGRVTLGYDNPVLEDRRGGDAVLHRARPTR